MWFKLVSCGLCLRLRSGSGISHSAQQEYYLGNWNLRRHTRSIFISFLVSGRSFVVVAFIFLISWKWKYFPLLRIVWSKFRNVRDRIHLCLGSLSFDKIGFQIFFCRYYYIGSNPKKHENVLQRTYVLMAHSHEAFWKMKYILFCWGHFHM